MVVELREMYAHRALIQNLVVRDLKTRYRGSAHIGGGSHAA